MILTSLQDNEAVLSNVGATNAFTIKATAASFRILSSGLYSNKIRAIIRELSCNAVDSHIGAGKTDVPFEVHLPSMLEPWFSVRDSGMGLSNDEVVNTYASYFTSTKTNSNDFTGALGLGAKSPFSYTENFTVTAIKNGVSRIYSAFINEMGVPSIAEMSKELTDEGNGVEVKFSVTDKYDYNSFKYESQEVFKWFKNKPTVIGAQFDHDTISYKEENIVPGVHVHRDGSSIALMGNIAYPLNKISEPAKHFGDLAGLLTCGLVIEFKIGDLDFAASREELSYVPMTIKSIKRKLEELNENLVLHFADKANAITSEWARAEYLYLEGRTRLYAAAVKKYVADTKFELYDPAAYYGKKTFKYDVVDLTARQLDISAFSSYNGRRNKIGNTSEYVGGSSGYKQTMSIPVDSNIIIVLNDLKTGCASRAGYHFGSVGGNQSVYCISHSADDLSVRQIEYDALIKELHNPPIVMKASELKKREPVKREPLSNTGIATLVEKDTTGYYNKRKEYKWVPFNGTLSDATIYYYVCLNGYEPETLTGDAFNVIQLRQWMDTSGIADIKDISIMGVRKNRIKEIKDRANWIWVEERLKEETSKVSDTHITAMVAADILDHWSTTPYTRATVASIVSKDSDYAKFAIECNNIKRANGEVANLVRLCKNYGKTVQVETVTKKLEDSKKLIMGKYPLIRHLSSATDHEIAQYITLVDSQETI